MSKTLERVQALVGQGEVRVSLHGYEELGADDIAVRDAVSGLSEAVEVEDYPDYPKVPCVLVLQEDARGRPIHLV